MTVGLQRHPKQAATSVRSRHSDEWLPAHFVTSIDTAKPVVGRHSLVPRLSWRMLRIRNLKRGNSCQNDKGRVQDESS